MHSNNSIDPAILDEVNEDVAVRHFHKDFRPQAVMIVMNAQGEILIIQSSKNHKWWGFPQGGIDASEDLIDAIIRELGEEVGLQPSEISIAKYCGCNQIEIPHWSRDGFTKGKKYHYILVRCENPTITLQVDEVSDFKWVKPDDVEREFAGLDEEKRRTLLEALGVALA